MDVGDELNKEAPPSAGFFIISKLANNMSYLLLHFDGDITRNHTVSLRTLGKSLIHLQAAVNRAHLDIRYGEVWKGARLSHEDYIETELWSRPPQEGGYIIDFINDSPKIKATLSRMINAITPAVELSKSTSLAKAASLVQQLDLTREQIRLEILNPIPLEQYIPEASQRPYGDRAINKEIDQLISTIRTPTAGQSTIELTIGGAKSSTFKFNRTESENFHELVSNRRLGDPIIFSAKVLELDSKNKSGRILNVVTQREVKINFADEGDFNEAKPFLGLNQPMAFIGCPIYEGGTFDINGGDIFFARLL